MLRLSVLSSSTVLAQALFPDCIMKDKILRGRGEFSLFTDVSPFGLSGCFLENCQDSDKWISPSEAVCAESCGRVPGCTHWSYGLEEGHTKCWLRTSDHGAEPHEDFVSGESSCVPPEYPTCLKTHIKYESEGEQALFDISRLGKTIGCTDKLCEATWHYHSPSLDDCATTCAQTDGCSHHSFGKEPEGPVCYLFGANVRETEAHGMNSGYVGCAPITAWEAPLIQQAPATAPVSPGNTACWSGGFSFELCCAQQHGPYGNPQCWDSALFTFDKCCFAPDDRKEEL